MRTLLQASTGCTSAGPLAPLQPPKADPDDACLQATGVNTALSDLLHFGFGTMRARSPASTPTGKKSTSCP